MDLHVYKVDDGEQHWYVAESSDEALAMHYKQYGAAPGDFGDAVAAQVPDAEILKIYLDEPFQDPSPSVTMPAREWATAKGCIGSTCC